MKRIVRKRRLSAGKAVQYSSIRGRIASELPDILDRHRDRMEIREQLRALFSRLKSERELKGLSLADLTELTGMDRSALSKLETGQRFNPTIDTLARYAEAVGKHLVVTLNDATVR